MGQRTYFAWRCQCQRQLLFRYFDISIFQGKFLSVYTPRNLVNETCFIELLSIVRHRGLLEVPIFFLKTINMNLVFDFLREK